MSKISRKFADWKRNNKVGLRNFSEACDFHDIVKTLIMRMLRRKHQDSNKDPIYSEYGEECDDFPDIWMRLYEGKGKRRKASIYVWEIQEKIDEYWLEKITEKYKDVNLIIVDLNKIKKQIGKNYNMEKLKKVLEQYLI